MASDYLFGKVDWFSVERTQQEKMRSEIANLDRSRVLNSSIDDLADYFEGEYTLTVPSLDKDGIIADQQEKDIDVSGDRGRYWSTPGPHFIRGTELSLTVPFSGDSEFFCIRPASYTMNSPRAEIRGRVLVLRIADPKPDPAKVRAEFDRRLQHIEGNLTNLRNCIAPYNAAIRNSAKQQLEARKSKLLSDQNLVAELGYNLRPREKDTSTYAAPQVRRKLKPSLPPQSTKAFKPEPALPSEDYEHILNVLENMTLVMERSPSAFETIDEEGLRTHFLVQLNGHYEGQATGETFNSHGKTDILLRVEGKNIFIAECKFWGGPMKLTETVDQLVSYSCWRDTKVALMIFNRRKNFSAVLEAIAPTIEKHPNFKRTIPANGETRFRFILAHKDDPAREMIVSVLLFDVPNPNFVPQEITSND
jgi:hypothetical protein